LFVDTPLENKIAPSDEQKGQLTREAYSPLISQNIRLPELAPFFSLLVFSSFVR